MTAARRIDWVDTPDRLAALLDPIRRAVLHALDRPDSATGVARRLGLARQKVNYHLRALETAGFVRFVDARPRRGCIERRYEACAEERLVDPRVASTGTAPAPSLQDRFSSAVLLGEAARLTSEVARQREAAEAAGQPMATMSLSAAVDIASPAAWNAFAEDLRQAVAEVVRKHHHPGGGARTQHLFLGLHPQPPHDDPSPEPSR